MSTPTATPTIEDSIKTALDAADAAITVSSEFDQIRNDYTKTRVEVKAINRQVMIVFVSSLAASVLAVTAAGLIYFRTMSEMETTNATSLEALVIFAENVDRLAAATTEANAHAERIAGLVEGMATLEVMIGDLATRLDAQGETTLAGLAAANTEITGMVGQSTSAVVREVSAAIEAQQSALMAELETLRSTEMASSTEAGPSRFDEIAATLETMMMLQREISAKITVAATPPRAPARTPTPPTPRAAPVDNDIIKFP
ncbi:hypothetical protein [Roseicyclus sp.]|jgi:hypothetical protein|uniref:hypothetical protein n=1 Tax=Roseicyclus sp. TaxID=1914329 RepID=UPI004053B97A